MKAPPRRILAPARLTAAAAASTCSSDLGRARAGHDDHFVAADRNIADSDDRVLGPEGPARELVRLGDAEDLLDAVEDLDQPGIADLPPDRADDRPQRAGRPVHVEAHFDQLCDDALDLLAGRAFLHYYNHKETQN